MLSISILLFLIIDPFGNMVIINSLLSDFNTKEKRIIVLRESAIATIILIASAFFGAKFIALIGLDESSMKLSGGIVLFLIALGMLFPSRRMTEENLEQPPVVVPIAMPLIAGPSAISMVIIFSNQVSSVIICSSILLVVLITTVILILSTYLMNVLGKSGALALERLMGMLLIMLSVQMILEGLYTFMNSKI